MSLDTGDENAKRAINPLSARDGLSCPAVISVLELKCYYVSDTFWYSSRPLSSLLFSAYWLFLVNVI